MIEFECGCGKPLVVMMKVVEGTNLQVVKHPLVNECECEYVEEDLWEILDDAYSVEMG